MANEDAFLTRLQLLIIMTKAYLNGYPLGKYRKIAILENAREIFYLSLKRKSALADKTGSTWQKNREETMKPDYLLHLKIQELSVMAAALADDNTPMSQSKQASMETSLDHICDALTFSCKFDDINFLKVA